MFMNGPWGAALPAEPVGFEGKVMGKALSFSCPGGLRTTDIGVQETLCVQLHHVLMPQLIILFLSIASLGAEESPKPHA